jgi:hypothetical protein
MNEYITKLIFYFMQFRRESDTKIFSTLKHNNDLCPKIKLKIEDILNRYKRYRTIAYDIQGFKDEGTDILVRLSNDDETCKYVCFQIKSNDDLKDVNYLSKLKAQALDTQNSYGSSLLDYYILVCCDITCDKNKKSNINKLRQIEAAFNKVPNIHVIEPAYIMGFLNISSLQLDVIIKNKMSNEDIIIKDAIDILIDLTPTERALLYYLIYENIILNNSIVSIDKIVNDNFIYDTYSRVKDYERIWFFSDEDEGKKTEKNYYNYKYKYQNRDFKERIINDLEYLSYNYIQLVDYEKVIIDIATVLPIASLLIDGCIRYEYNQTELLNYLMILMNGMKGYDN